MSCSHHRVHTRRAICLLAIGVLGAGAAACTSSAPPSVDTDGPNPAIAQVSARVMRYFEAISTGDSAAVADGLADDYRLVGVSGALWNKSQRIQELSANGPAFGTVTPSEVEIRLYDSTAVVIGLATILEPADTIRERFTQVWVLDRTSWRMVSGQITAVETPLPSPPPQA